MLGTVGERSALGCGSNTVLAGEFVYDVTFENVQAGLRTDYLFRLANQRGGIVLGTGALFAARLFPVPGAALRVSAVEGRVFGLARLERSRARRLATRVPGGQAASLLA